MQMRMTNHSYRSNQSSGQNKKKAPKKNYEYPALDENEDMENDESDALCSGDESDHFGKRSEDALENHNEQIENGRQEGESSDTEEEEDELSEVDDWYEEDKDDTKKKKPNGRRHDNESDEFSEEEGRNDGDDAMDDLVNAHN